VNPVMEQSYPRAAEANASRRSGRAPSWTTERHGLGTHSAGAVAAMTKALQEITAAATK
jgi:hypothetical protein